MARRFHRARGNPLSLAFLDVMFCGFGSVILLFLILDHNMSAALVAGDPLLEAEIDLLDEEVTEGQEDLARIRNTLAEVSLEVVTAEGLARQIQERIDSFLEELAAMENSSLASSESIERLRADVEQLEEDVLRLQASALEQEGANVRQFVGDGNRQYLSGLFLGGQRILILLDSSASMLDSTLVNILRTRNMADERKLEAPKWQRAVRTVDWLTAQLPITSRYQIIGFAEDFRSLIAGSQGQWQEVADRDQLNAAVAAVRQLVPAGGTNLERAFRGVAGMAPLPDNIFLITDGLPTLSGDGGGSGLVTPRARLDKFDDALRELPDGIPVNVILLPLEGDPSAAALYWQLAQLTAGSFLSPSRDWP